MRLWIVGIAVLCFAGLAGTAPVKRETSLTGVVTTADGTPAKGAVVWAAKLDGRNLERVETKADDAGKYALRLPAGERYVWANAGPQGGEAFNTKRDRTFTVGDGNATTTADIRLEKRGTLKGRLLDKATGKPLAGGRIYLDNGMLLASNAEGRFEAGGLERTNHESFVVVPGKARIRVLFDTTGSENTELDIPLSAPGGKVVGRVEDQAGKPMPGAAVGRYTSGSWFSISGLWEPCAADGSFVYEGTTLDAKSEMVAEAEGYEAEQEEYLVESADKPVELVIKLKPKPGQVIDPKKPEDANRRKVSGTVRGPDGKPLAGVLVRWGYEPYTNAIETRTDANGAYSLAVPEVGRQMAVLPSDAEPQFPKVPAGGDQVVNFDLKAGNAFTGKVVDDDGKPIANVSVVPVIASPDPMIGNPFWLSEAAARTDETGKFELKGIPAGARFDFMKRGLSDKRNLSLFGDGADNEIVLAFAGAIKGKVVDEAGKPIRNFRIQLSFPKVQKKGDNSGGYFAGYSSPGVRFSSPDGTFVLTGVNAEGVFRVVAVPDGYRETELDRVRSVAINRLAKTEAVTLNAGPAKMLKVLARSSDGKPVADARVQLVKTEPGQRNHSWSHGGWTDSRRERTDASGTATFKDLSFADAGVRVRAPGMARQMGVWDGEAKELSYNLKPEAVISGVISRAEGAESDLYLEVSWGTESIMHPIAADGKYRIDELPAGSYTLGVRGARDVKTLLSTTFEMKEGERKEWGGEVKK